MSRTISADDLVDADAESLERVWRELQILRSPQRRSPRTYRAISQRLPDLSEDEATAIRAELRRGLHPLAILFGHWDSLVPNLPADMPALGRYTKAAAAA